MSSKPEPDRCHIPTSEFLEGLLNKTPGDAVSVNWIMEQLGDRSYGLTLLVMAIVAVVPGGSTVIGVLIAWPAVQLAMGRHAPLLPGFLGRRRISVEKLARTIRFIVPRIRWIETLIRPRWPRGFATGRRLTGILVLLLGLTLILPVPFSHIIPAVTIMVLAIAFLEEDGVALTVFGLAGLGSLVFSVSQIWGALEFADWLDRITG